MFLDASLRDVIDDSTDFDQFCSGLDFEDWYVLDNFVL